MPGTHHYRWPSPGIRIIMSMPAPSWELKAFRDETPPTLYRYGASFLIALIPPLSNELMAQKLMY